MRCGLCQTPPRLPVCVEVRVATAGRRHAGLYGYMVMAYIVLATEGRRRTGAPRSQPAEWQVRSD